MVGCTHLRDAAHVLDDVEGEADDAVDDVAREARVEAEHLVGRGYTTVRGGVHHHEALAGVDAEHLLQDAQPQARLAQLGGERVELPHVREAVAALLRGQQRAELVAKGLAVGDGAPVEERLPVGVAVDGAGL